ncbi:peptidyl-prolyl cis-trans isomerase cyp18 [Candidatus Phycosocius bacilliformis]|uniref:Peptidyl-prolyl cis-trans isomerase cyp18 n=1 Tax=Candidatus Phycosocius bacilliformis TaxID=1445552 RepID=A0A2P2E821_9PROT|nr:peptidylprolyl isomerase [Candidatus Phycosocius bacilliformis]GBF57184.1 peptidyl-prolyl cis-trans isomerase cyp18 [Candidatus Phycosocius bacilliformis]
MKRRALLAGLLIASALILPQISVAQGSSEPAPALNATVPPAPKVFLTTTMGEIEITLDPVGAPKTSAHMLAMFQSGHYVGAAVFRIEPGFLIQIGDLDANFKGRYPPLKPVELETATNRHAKGAVGLARGDDPNSGHSSFYFDLAENASLNADPKAAPNTTGYASFGRVTAGWEVVEAMAKVERAASGGPFPGKAPVTPIVITGVRTDPPPPPKPKPAVRPAPKASKKKR